MIKGDLIAPRKEIRNMVKNTKTFGTIEFAEFTKGEMKKAIEGLLGHNDTLSIVTVVNKTLKNNTTRKEIISIDNYDSAGRLKCSTKRVIRRGNEVKRIVTNNIWDPTTTDNILIKSIINTTSKSGKYNSTSDVRFEYNKNDNAHKIWKKFGPSNKVTEFKYDDSGRTIYQSIKKGKTIESAIEYIYDEQGRIVHEARPEDFHGTNTAWDVVYEYNDNMNSETPHGVIKRTATSPEGNVEVTKTMYDEYGRVTYISLTDENGVTETYYMYNDVMPYIAEKTIRKVYNKDNADEPQFTTTHEAKIVVEQIKPSYIALSDNGPMRTWNPIDKVSIDDNWEY